MPRKIIKGRTKGAKRRLNAMLSKRQQAGVKAITRTIIRRNMETKTVGKQAENVQLFHNKALYLSNLLATTQGVEDPNDLTTNAARIGDSVKLTNLNIKFWLSNKLDRPNVMYRLIMFWYDTPLTLSDALCYSRRLIRCLIDPITRIFQLLTKIHLFPSYVPKWYREI